MTRTITGGTKLPIQTSIFEILMRDSGKRRTTAYFWTNVLDVSVGEWQFTMDLLKVFAIFFHFIAGELNGHRIYSSKKVAIHRLSRR